MKDVKKATVAPVKMPAKGKSTGTMPKETKAGKPEKFARGASKMGAMPKSEKATCYGTKGTK
jgi:hypothetical protein